MIMSHGRFYFAVESTNGKPITKTGLCEVLKVSCIDSQ